MDPHSADSLLFDDTLFNDLDLPLMLDAQPPATTAGAELRLRAIALVEDGRSEDSEERNENTPTLHRLEAKLDLVLALCASLVAQQRPPLLKVPVRWSARGLRLCWPSSAGPLPAVASITVQAADWLPDPVQLPASVLASQQDADGLLVWLRFDALGDGLQAAMERHVFRVHRRQVANSRRQR